MFIAFISYLVTAATFLAAGLFVGHLFDSEHRNVGNFRNDIPSTICIIFAVLLWLYLGPYRFF